MLDPAQIRSIAGTIMGVEAQLNLISAVFVVVGTAFKVEYSKLEAIAFVPTPGQLVADPLPLFRTLIVGHVHGMYRQ